MTVLLCVIGWRMFALGAALGHHAVRVVEATRRGLRWLRNRCPLFTEAATQAIVERVARRALPSVKLPDSDELLLVTNY